MKIKLFKSSLGNDEIHAASEVIRSNVLSLGKELESFEKEFANYSQKKYAVAVNSGTNALHLSVESLGWKQEDEVITTPFTYIASSNVLLYEKIRPVFADIDPFSLNLDPNEVLKKINSKTKGILLVHIFGLPANYRDFNRIKTEYGLKIIEDACQAVGRPRKNFPVSYAGDATCYSFTSNKQITTGGEGGMIVTDNGSVAERCLSLRDQGKTWHNNLYSFDQIGYSFRMTEIQAAIGKVQLKKLDDLLKQRQMIADLYQKYLRAVPEISTGFIDSRYKRSWFTFYICLKNKKIRNSIAKELQNKGIESRPYFQSLHLYKIYRDLGYKKGDFPVSESVSDTILCLPFYIGLSEENINEICTIIINNI